MANHPSQSLARLDAALILDATIIAIDRIDKHLADLKEAAILFEMREKNFLGLKWTQSRAEATRAVEKDDDIRVAEMVADSRKDDLHAIGKLATAALKGDGFIWVTVADFQRLTASYEIAVERDRVRRLTDQELADEKAAADQSTTGMASSV